jgi:tryptophan-rich sensory protein
MFDNKKLIIVLPLIVGFLIGTLTRPGEWYFNLKKPKLDPPPYVFGIAWTILYLLIGISYYLAFKDNTGSIKNKWMFWIIPVLHLLINFTFTPVLFGAKELFWSAILVSLTLILALITMFQFYKDKKMTSVYLLIPYICWLVFANYLGWSVYNLNH